MNERMRLIDDREQAVVGLWKQGYLATSTIKHYLQWVRRFRAYCDQRKLVEEEQLSLTGVLHFTRTCICPRLARRRIARNTCDSARNALHAWACALRTLGVQLPSWSSEDVFPSLSPLLIEYCQYRRTHIGIAESTLRRDIETAQRFSRLLRQRHKSLKRTTLADVDAFVQSIASRVSKGTVADTCSSLRAFLRFLHATGRLAADLARGVMAPRFRLSERPPRTLLWRDVRLILRSVRRSEPPGKRDFAMLLLLATYGLGAAEVLGLRLEDLDWSAGILRARRPKTKVIIELPLLPAVAHALAAYLRWERPQSKSTTYLFLRKNMPYERLTSGGIRHRIRHYARLAGISVRVIGAHAFRHSHATRQIDASASLKVVSEILGHRNSSSTSVYVRVAFRRLRQVALPVPR